MSEIYHYCLNCGAPCDCNIMDEETGCDNIYYCICDCPEIVIAEENAKNVLEMFNYG